MVIDLATIFAQLESACAELVSAWPTSRHVNRVISETRSADGKLVSVTLENKRGILQLALHLADAADSPVERVVLKLEETAAWEGVEFTPLKQAPTKPAAKWANEELEEQPLDWNMTPGVTIRAAGTACEIIVTGEALAALRRGGRFQFVDRYRN
jgi:hypothetical protein